MTPRMRWAALIVSFVLLVGVVALTSWQVQQIENMLKADACAFAEVELVAAERQSTLLLDAGIIDQAEADRRQAEFASFIDAALCPGELP